MPVQRRELLKSMGGAGLLGLASPLLRAQEQVARATRGMATPRIKDISVIECQPAGVRLTVVKITTDQDGLYGYGCATFTQRADLVKPAVEKYLKPFLLGKTTDRIEDIWQSCYDSSYWKNGPVLNNAISGVDQALWDIKGRQAGMPVYQLAGGKCREAVDAYAHADGAEFQEVVESAKGTWRRDSAMCACRWACPEWRAMARATAETTTLKALHDKPLFEPAYDIRRALEAARSLPQGTGRRGRAAARHARAPDAEPGGAVLQGSGEVPHVLPGRSALAGRLGYFRQIRQNCATPIAMGELFNSPHEWQPLIAERLIDYIRVHVSQAGGFSPARKIAILAEQYGVKTAWHGPGDVSPVGHMANVTLDLVSYNFGIQEYSPFNERTQEIFHGCPEMKDGYLWVSEKPGWGIEIDEKAAAKSPFTPGRTT